MGRQAFQRILFAAGIATALLGLYAAANTSTELRWDSIVSIAIIAAGVYMTVVGVVLMLGTGEPAIETEAEEGRRLPDVAIPLVYGGFVGLIALVAGLVAGHYLGRNQGFITFIFAFVVANLIFGLPLALAGAASKSWRT